jgi:hypothetical protein
MILSRLSPVVLRSLSSSRMDALFLFLVDGNRDLDDPTDSTPGKLADAEIHFTGGELDGSSLLALPSGRNATAAARTSAFPSRQFTVQGERRSLSLLRRIAKRNAQEGFGESGHPGVRGSHARVVENGTALEGAPRMSGRRRRSARTLKRQRQVFGVGYGRAEDP